MQKKVLWRESALAYHPHVRIFCLAENFPGYSRSLHIFRVRERRDEWRRRRRVSDFFLPLFVRGFPQKNPFTLHYISRIAFDALPGATKKDAG